jgi:multiple sugar transport system permease protein
MPIISAISARSAKTRLTFALIYAVLGIGAISMLYPLGLMLAGSAKSETDFYDNTPYISYLWDDQLLWRKYLESKYTTISDAEQAHSETWGSWDRIYPSDNGDFELANAFRVFRTLPGWRPEWGSLGHVRYQALLGKNARRFRALAQSEFGNSLAHYNNASESLFTTWLEVGPPRYEILTRRFNFADSPDYELYDRLKRNSPPADLIISDTDASFVAVMLRSRWGTIEEYNEAHGTNYRDYRQVFLNSAAPAQAQQRADWESYVRQELGLSFIRVLPNAQAAYIQFLRSRYENNVEFINRAWGKRFTRIDEIDVPSEVPSNARQRADWTSFVKDGCPLEALRVSGPRQAFENYLGRPIDSVRLPIATVDWIDFQQAKPSLRWEFVTSNYRFVIDYLLLHSRGIQNTIIFCGLMVMASLIINPLAAYGLSRYRPPSTYAILMFCMATMAFPTEVTMIPSFLLLKRFPLYSLIAGAMAGLLVIWLTKNIRIRRAATVRGLLSVATAIIVGWWLLPLVVNKFAHSADGSVSLLNTFWALVLPNIANGFSIFLLKGFFDSLPQELYEAAELDGATEWHKFWVVTMSLSKPILAVIALGVFSTAYSEFMMALVIVPDQRMWTIMVWLFQLQSSAYPSVIYASLTIAAIPTFAVFLFAQNLILRGIVVPTEK